MSIILNWYSKRYIIYIIIYLLYHNTMYDAQHVLVHRSLLIIYYITINFIGFFSIMLPCWLVIEKHTVIVSQQRAYIRIKYSLYVGNYGRGCRCLQVTFFYYSIYCYYFYYHCYVVISLHIDNGLTFGLCEWCLYISVRAI